MLRINRLADCAWFSNVDPNITDLATLTELIGNDRSKIRSFAFRSPESARKDIARIEDAMI